MGIGLDRNTFPAALHFPPLLCAQVRWALPKNACLPKKEIYFADIWSSIIALAAVNIQDPVDPADAQALRDDLANNVLPQVRDAIQQLREALPKFN